MAPIISIIAAISRNRALGKDNKLLWKIPEDLERFKKLTFGHPVIMGRSTFESIGKLLTGRLNIIITRNPRLKIRGGIVCNSLEDAIKKARETEDREIFIIGGGQIYGQGIKLADKLYLTVVEGEYEADTYFPDYSMFSKKIFEKKSSFGDYKYKFLELIKNV